MDPIYRPFPKPAEIPLQEIPRKLTDLNTDINMDFKENPLIKRVSCQRCTKGLISNFSRNDQNYLELPKQADIDKILKIIQRKVLKGTHLPVTMKEIQAGYLISP